MQGGLVSYGLLCALAIALLVAAVTDWRRRQIDNWLNAAIALGAPIFWIATGMGWIDIGFQIAIAAVMFLLLLGLFAAGWMGGGDVKLLTALALWIHPVRFVELLVIMSVAGGVLTLVMLVWSRVQGKRGKIAVPYGIAISFAGLSVLAGQYVPIAHDGGFPG